MTMKEMIGVVKEAMGLGLASVKITGGEPLLREDLEELLRFCSGKKIGTWIETNGTLIDAKTAKMLKDAELDLISVSLDSSFAEKHDAFRGRKGAFERTVQGIRNLVGEGFAPQVIMTLCRENMEDFAHFLELMKELGVSDVKVNIISCIGRGHDMQRSGVTPTVEEVLRFGENLDAIKVSFEGYVFLDLPAAFKSLEDVKKRNFGKCAVKNILGLLSDGSVSLCGIGYMDEALIFGNVRGNPSALKDIWFGNPVLKRIREDIPAKLRGVCGICVFKNICTGSCRAEAHQEGGDLITAPSRLCQTAYEKGLFPVTRLVPESLRT
jgi:SynChlorMet cassette radical SAM/SPASM protein ScmF